MPGLAHLEGVAAVVVEPVVLCVEAEEASNKEEAMEAILTNVEAVEEDLEDPNEVENEFFV